VVQSADAISYLRRVLSEEHQEYSGLFAQPVPQSLVATSKRVQNFESRFTALGTQEANEAAKRLPQGLVTQNQIDQAVGPVLTQIESVGAQLDDAMTALAGSQCEVTGTS
jgi:hypothetical protein